MREKIILLLFVTVLNAQNPSVVIEETKWLDGWTNFKPKVTPYKEPNVILTGDISVSTKLIKKNVYKLMGTVRVTNKATLTIEPGTVIRGDNESLGLLVVTKGSKIIAEGTVTDPIIFTSNKSPNDRKAGDWGGLMILGNAPTNKIGGMGQIEFDSQYKNEMYGGSIENDNSGSLKYVRIEFAGKKDWNNVSSNALTLAGVGSKTIFENINITYSNDDAVQVFGGKISMDKIVTYKCKDDDFDITSGSQCLIKNSIIMRSPFISDVLRSRGFEIENHDKKIGFDSTKKETNVQLDNILFYCIDENKGDMIKEAIFLNENTNLSITNSKVVGFKGFIAFDNYFFKDDNYKKNKMSNIIIDNCENTFSNVKFDFNFEAENKLSEMKEWFSKGYTNSSGLDQFKQTLISYSQKN